MRLSTFAKLTSAGVIGLGLALPATAQSDIVITLDAYVGVTASYEPPFACERIRLETSVTEDDRLPLGQAAVHTQYGQLNYKIENECTPGATFVVIVSALLEELTPQRASVDPLLRSATMSYHGTARTRTCTQLPNGRFDCQDGTTPMNIEGTWKGKGKVTRDGSSGTFPQGDGTVVYNRSRYGFREADAVFTGTIGERTVNLTTPGYIQDGGFLEIMYPEP